MWAGDRADQVGQGIKAKIEKIQSSTIPGYQVSVLLR